MNKPKVVAFLPAKGTSSRIENKNVKLLDGKPLFLHTLEKLLQCTFIDEVYLDTEDDYLLDLASYLDFKVLKRDPELANNKTDGNQLFLNEVNYVDADIYIQILSTSPFIETNTIQKGVETLIASDTYDSAFLTRNEKLYTWTDNKSDYDMNNIPNSFTLKDTTIETMGLYIVKRDTALATKRRIGDNPFLLEASPLEAIDVNYPEDFDLANLIASGKREKERKLLDNIKNQLTSSMLSDILDDLVVSGTILNYSLNLNNKKILGKAKTLKLRKLHENEDYKGIYGALHSYDTIIPNDIIIVENEVPQFAYFGELNANLAIRSGASGAIIGGATRDTKEVIDLDFPVFAKGSSCKDVRKRATLESYNKVIEIEGIKIAPNDLIFGDCDGIIVIPQKHEKEIIEKALKVLKKEKNILLDIANNESIESIIKNNGFF